MPGGREVVVVTTSGTPRGVPAKPVRVLHVFEEESRFHTAAWFQTVWSPFWDASHVSELLLIG